MKTLSAIRHLYQCRKRGECCVAAYTFARDSVRETAGVQQDLDTCIAIAEDLARQVQAANRAAVVYQADACAHHTTIDPCYQPCGVCRTCTN